MRFPLLALIPASAIGFSWYAYHRAFYVPKIHPADPDSPIEGEQYEAVAHLMHRATEAIRKHTFEEVRITSNDGIPLYGRLYLQDENAPVEIIFHGYRSCAFRDCCGGHTLAWKMGFNTILVDQRASGESGGRAITFGIRERYDCLSWARYTAERFGKDVPIILSGLSMGAATVLSAAELDLPDNVAAIMADSPFDSPETIIRKVCRDEKLPDKLAFPFISIGARFFGGFNLRESSAMSAIQTAKVPILIIHGEDDRYVPCDMSRKLRDHCASPCTLFTVPNAGHGLAYMIDPEGYENTVFRFLKSVPSVAGKIKGSPITPDT